MLLKDSSDDPITGVAFDDASLSLSYNLQTVGTWVTPTLVDGTLGTYLANSWKEIGGGIYQWCPPNAVVVANTNTLVRAVYGANDPQYDTIEARLPAVSSAGAVELDSGSAGSATEAKQDEILAAVESMSDSFAAAVARLQLEVQIEGFPAAICRNADYRTETESEIRLTLLDLTGVAITDIAGTPLANVTWLFGMGSERAPAIIAGSCSWDDTTDELIIELPKASTAEKDLGSITWQIGVSIGTDPNVYTRWLGGGTSRLIERHF